MSLGFETNLGLGPLRLGGKAGLGAGGVERGTWYEPIADDKDFVVQAQGGIGLSGTEFYKGVGAAIDWDNDRLPSVPSLPSLPTRVYPTRGSLTQVGDWYTVGKPTIVPLPSTPTNVRAPTTTVSAPLRPSLLEFSAGADLGPIHEGTRFSVGGGAPVTNFYEIHANES